MLGMFAEIERDLISLRTKEALAARKAAGVRLGRKPGAGKSRLDKYRPEIEALLRNGSRKNFIAARYKVTEPTLYNWLAKNNIDTKPRVER
jgi:DNA invertase Pin-like site-specific DNA recombinase